MALRGLQSSSAPTHHRSTLSLTVRLGRLHTRSVSVGCMAKEQQQQQQQAAPAFVRRPVEVSRSMAAARAAESARPADSSLFVDPYAATLCSGSSNSSSSAVVLQEQQQQAMMDVIATRYIDESLLNAMAATNVNTIQSGDYRQVVLLGDGMDCRPFRLPWPPGTLLFLVAPSEVHEQAEALLAAAPAPAHVMRGCLLRRVNMNWAAAAAAAAAVTDTADTSAGATNGGSAAAAADGGAAGVTGSSVNNSSSSTIFMEQLLRAGFRADRLSVWALQGLHDQGVTQQQLQQLLAEVTNCAAFHSLLVGELPGPMSKKTAENLLAEAGLLGAVFGYKDEGYGRWQEVPEQRDYAAAVPGSEQGGSSSEGSYTVVQQQQQQQQQQSGGDVVADRWLCTGQQLRLSLEQMGIYEEWSAEYAENDMGDDFIGNFS